MSILSNSFTAIDAAKEFAAAQTRVVIAKQETIDATRESDSQNLKLTRVFFDMLKDNADEKHIRALMEEMRDQVRTAFMAAPHTAFPEVERNGKWESSTKVRERRLASALTILNRCYLVAYEYFTGKSKDKEGNVIPCDKVTDSDNITSPCSAATRRDKAARKAGKKTVKARDNDTRMGTEERKYLASVRRLGMWKDIRNAFKVNPDGVVTVEGTAGTAQRLAAFNAAIDEVLAMTPDEPTEAPAKRQSAKRQSAKRQSAKRQSAKRQSASPKIRRM